MKKKENLKKKLEEEKKNLENIISKHKTECVKVIQDLEKQNGDIKIDLDSKREKLYKKKEDYFYIQSKFSLPKKEHEEYYKNLHNKKNFLDMKKHLYIINTEDELNKRLFEKSFQRMKILSDKIRLGDITNYMPTESQPIIDTNPEQKIISSLFSNSELESIKKIYEQESDNPSENFLKFKEKITKLEKGEALKEERDDNHDSSGALLENEYSKIENEIKTNEEIASLEEFKVKTKGNEITKLEQERKSKLKKNYNLKKEEKNLKNELTKLEERYSNILHKKQRHKEVNDMMEEINNIYKGIDSDLIKEEENNKNKNLIKIKNDMNINKNKNISKEEEMDNEGETHQIIDEKEKEERETHYE